MTPKPIETHYAGCRFRSRLEARWAVFFDQLGVRWEYEPEGFLVGESRRPYLPDFRIDRGDALPPLWVEVKGADSMLDQDLLAAAVHPETGIGDAILILGPVPEPMPTPKHATVRNIFGHACVVGAIVWRGMTLLQFGRENILDETTKDKPLVAAATADSFWTVPDFQLPEDIQAAYIAARTARFEHGEAPQLPGRVATPATPKPEPEPDSEPSLMADLRTRWKTLVGAELAVHTEPHSLENGSLAVIATSSAWSQQVRLLAGPLLRRLNEEFGEGTITKVTAPAKPRKRKP